MERIWITGAGGLIGNCIAQSSARPRSAEITSLTRNKFDLTDFAAMERAFRQERPEIIIHCAAMSKSPACQKQPELARTINVEVTRRLVELCADRYLLFFSTDLVFDGANGKYREDDPVNPLSIYGETKVEAERIVQANAKHCVVRTSLNAGHSPTGDRSFVEETRSAWERGEVPSFFVDEFRNPIPAETTARAVWELVARRASGTYHVAGAERLSRAEIGELLAQKFPQLQPRFTTSSLKEYRGAPRSPDTSLNCSKVLKLLSFPLPSFRDWLANQQFEANSPRRSPLDQ